MIQKVIKLIEFHDYEVPTNDMKLKQFINKLGVENIDDLYKVKKANFYAKNPACVSLLKKIEEEYERMKAVVRKTSFIRKNELKLNGKDLILLGVDQDNVGKVIDHLYYEIITGNLKNNKEKLTDYVVNQVVGNLDNVMVGEIV